MVNTTYSSQKSEPITTESIQEAIRGIRSTSVIVKVELCKKHYTALLKKFKVERPYDMEFPSMGFGFVSGIPIIIKPYIKKARVYSKKII